MLLGTKAALSFGLSSKTASFHENSPLNSRAYGSKSNFDGLQRNPASGAFRMALELDERGSPQAETLYQAAVADGDCVPDALCNLGLLRLRRGNRTGAFDYYTRALQHNPRHFESHYNLACFYLEALDLDLAQLHLEICACLEPSRLPQVYLDLGVVFTLKEDYEAARRHLETYRAQVGGANAAGADALLGCVETLTSVEQGLITGN